MRIKSIILSMSAASLMFGACNNISNSNVELTSQADSASYAIGADIGNNIKNNLSNSPGGKDLSPEIILAAFEDVIKENDVKIAEADIRTVIQTYFMEAQTRVSEENKVNGAKFLEENAKRSEIKTTESGLQYEILKEGTGAKPSETDQVKVHYHGTLIDGTVFDSSVDRGEPTTFGVNRVIKGWTEALQLMPVGSKWKIYVPSELAYGERGAGSDIGPNSTLVFEVELLEIVKAEK